MNKFDLNRSPEYKVNTMFKGTMGLHNNQLLQNINQQWPWDREQQLPQDDADDDFERATSLKMTSFKKNNLLSGQKLQNSDVKRQTITSITQFRANLLDNAYESKY